MGWLPDAWAALSQKHPEIARRGLDSRQGIFNSVAMEINSVPYFETHVPKRAIRIPRLSFPTKQQSGGSRIVTDVRAYSRHRIFEQLLSWDHSANSCLPQPLPSDQAVCVPKCSCSPIELNIGPGLGTQGGRFLRSHDDRMNLQVGGDDDTCFEVHFDHLPEFYSRIPGGRWIAEAPDSETSHHLAVEEFDSEIESFEYVADPTVRESLPRETYTATLSDGTVVEYVWVLFVDQPTLRLRHWQPGEKQALQSRVEAIHAKQSWDVMDPPSSGKLVELDPGLLLVPPTQYATGFVPIAIGQRKAELVSEQMGERRVSEQSGSISCKII